MEDFGSSFLFHNKIEIFMEDFKSGFLLLKHNSGENIHRPSGPWLPTFALGRLIYKCTGPEKSGFLGSGSKFHRVANVHIYIFINEWQMNIARL